MVGQLVVSRAVVGVRWLWQAITLQFGPDE
jgi:hypothetical protein